MSRSSRGRGRIGILVPFTNTNLEADMAMLCPEGISMHYTRISGYELNEIPDENQMANMGTADLSEPLRLLAGVNPDVILYGCTSATLTHGPTFDTALSQQVKTQHGIPTVTAAGALVNALKTLAVNKIAFASPYVENINLTAISFLTKCGFETVSSAGVEEELDNYGQGSLTPGQVCELARQANSPDAQAIVLSCTDMRAVEIINTLELELKKPVVSSNQAMLFAALNTIKVPAEEIDCGALFRKA